MESIEGTQVPETEAVEETEAKETFKQKIIRFSKNNYARIATASVLAGAAAVTTYTLGRSAGHLDMLAFIDEDSDEDQDVPSPYSETSDLDETTEPEFELEFDEEESTETDL